jgi:hypothetical protein
MLSSSVYAGAWGAASFENDMAGDWGYELEKSNDSTLLLNTLTAVMFDGYIDSDLCSSAVAATDVVASLKDSKIENLPDGIVKWVEDNKELYEPEMSKLALKALEECKDKKRSELSQLWAESKSNEWLNEVAKLEIRLK